jgi:hypothetical protein
VNNRLGEQDVGVKEAMNKDLTLCPFWSQSSHESSTKPFPTTDSHEDRNIPDWALLHGKTTPRGFVPRFLSAPRFLELGGRAGLFSIKMFGR